jgi:hypothetical protein
MRERRRKHDDTHRPLGGRGKRAAAPRTKAQPAAVLRCSWHKPSGLGYLQFFADAEERDARGELQRQCPLCGLWHWPHEWGDEPDGLNLPVIHPEPES